MAKVYPDLENIGSLSYDKHPSNLESNCGQIFSKTPALTKEILDIIELKDLAPKNTSLCGHVFRTRRIWVLSGLFLLFVSSSIGMIIMTFTDTFDKILLSNFILANNTPVYENWKNPKVKVLVKIHIFNYTNLKAYEAGLADKLQVKDVGPYVYEESLERINVRFHSDGTLSYQDTRSYNFRSDLSKKHKESDKVVVPNVPMLGAVSISRHTLFMTRLGLSTLFNGMDVHPFLELSASKFIWGYDDMLYTIARSVMAFKEYIPYKNFGLMITRNGTSSDVIRINTGKNNFWKLGYVDSFNGISSLPYWSTSECNKIQGSDGSMFPPYAVRNKQPVYVYKRELCRSIPLVYQKEITAFKSKVPANRYVLPQGLFDIDARPENQCFCDVNSGECPVRGVFNATPCSFGAPFFISFPHFLNADPDLLSDIEGLHPDPETHDSFIDLHNLGFPISGTSRMQINVQATKPSGISQMDIFHREMLLPVAWVEVSLTEKDIPEDLVDIINTLTFTVRNTEMALKYGSILTAIVTLLAILIVLKNQWQEEKERS